MQFIKYFGNDAYTNIAMDTWLLYHLKAKEPVFSLWQNKNAVIVGRNQNTFAEVNQDYIDQHDIQVVRRVSGGGAVYHDLGNICFTFFVPVPTSSEVDFRKFVQPMYDALREVGIDAEITGRNDLTVDGKKVSGNAQRYAGGYLMHHGTLLWNSNVDTMVRSLNVADEKFISKAATSVRSRVGNIKDYAPSGLTLERFLAALQYYLSDEGKDQEYVLTDEQKKAILKLRNDRFATWNWNYGHSPKFDFNNHHKFAGGAIDVHADVAQGLIQNIDFTGDFLGVRDWREMKDQLIGQPFNANTIYDVLQKNAGGQYFGSIDNRDLADMFSTESEENIGGTKWQTSQK
ncbi:lipoate--protein ligase [Oenococcus sicerae]|uniref:lipoate--protein ligase n=1 Tax=Oenococcus sicerae TaxID=2203724 RepID=UPI0039EA58F0